MPNLPEFRNAILAELPAEEMDALRVHLEPVDLPLGFIIVSAGEPVDYVYFLERGLGSIVVVTPAGKRAEAGMFGSEGFAPTSPAVGLHVSFPEVIIQSPGSGHRIGVLAFCTALAKCPVFLQRVQRVSHNLATQASYTALSNGVHKTDVRLARWLLMCQDRVGGEIIITHDYISMLLAVRRPSVTEALHVLEGEGFISSKRKLVSVRNRAAMGLFARDAYGQPEEEYRLLFDAVGELGLHDRLPVPADM